MLIEPTRWTEYLDELSRHAEGSDTTFEVMYSDLGDQFEVRRVPLRENGFVPHEGIAIAVGGKTSTYPVVLRHVIAHPQRLETSEEPGFPSALKIDADDGTTTLIRIDLAAAPVLHTEEEMRS
jgi:hypothetical protein